MKEDSTTSGGKEYVSVSEFAKRMDVTRQTVYGYINKGILKTSDPHKDGSRLLDWAKDSVKFKTAWKKKMKNNPVKKQVRAKNSAKKKTVPAESVVIKRKPKGDLRLIEPSAQSEPSLPSADTPDNPADMVMRINPWEHPDCWLGAEEGVTEPTLDKNGNPLLDWDRIKTKMMAESYAFQLEVKRGQYIAKEDYIASMSALVQMVLSALTAIPSRFGSTFVAYAERDFGHEMSPKGRQGVNAVLVEPSKKIVSDIRTEAQKILEAVDGKD